MPVSATHPQYDKAKLVWRKTRDACTGSPAIKGAGTLYLSDFIPPDIDRYTKYLDNAYFLDVTGRTRDALIGMIFRKPPTYTIPDALQPILENADGAGASLVQMAKESAGSLLETGRYGLMVDYPSADPNIDAETEARLGLRPIISAYPAESITNWRTDVINGKTVLTMITLLEYVNDPLDEFDTTTMRKRYRVLRLTEGVYTQQIYNDQGLAESDLRVPLMANRQPFDHIPFHIIGSQNNRADVDDSPLLGLAEMNITHYRISAMHMENLDVHGQLTMGVTSSLSADQWQQMNPDGLLVGARKGVFLGETGALHSLTAPESSSLERALEARRDEMVSIGARIITSSRQNETAEAARLDAASESSVLDMMVGNMGEGFEASLEDCARFMGVDPNAVLYEFNHDFFDQRLDPQTVMAVIQLGDTGIISRSVQRMMIRSGRVEIPADVTDEDIDGEILETGL